MEPKDHKEVCFIHVSPSMRLHELLNFSASPGPYLFLVVAVRPSTFLMLKGVNPFCQPTFFVCMLKLTNPN